MRGGPAIKHNNSGSPNIRLPSLRLILFTSSPGDKKPPANPSPHQRRPLPASSIPHASTLAVCVFLPRFFSKTVYPESRPRSPGIKVLLGQTQQVLMPGGGKGGRLCRLCPPRASITQARPLDAYMSIPRPVGPSRLLSPSPIFVGRLSTRRSTLTSLLASSGLSHWP